MHYRANRVDRMAVHFEQFLKLAPDDPQASIVRQQLKQLKAATAG